MDGHRLSGEGRGPDSVWDQLPAPESSSQPKRLRRSESHGRLAAGAGGPAFAKSLGSWY